MESEGSVEQIGLEMDRKCLQRRLEARVRVLLPTLLPCKGLQETEAARVTLHIAQRALVVVGVSAALGCRLSGRMLRLWVRCTERRLGSM